jgi:ribonuclease VapC
MNRIVLDTSALLAVLQEEQGAEIFEKRPELLNNSMMSAVNITEAFGKLLAQGIKSAAAWEAVTSPIPEIVDFDTEQARIAGELLSHTRRLGLSLGDRACLALGIMRNAPIYTADQVWKRINVDVAVHVIR